MARAATTTDVFNAVAEPRRREILDLLAAGERPVGDLGAVSVRDAGRQRLYRVNGEALKPIHEWVGGFERMWSERFDALDEVLDELKGDHDDGERHDDGQPPG